MRKKRAMRSLTTERLITITTRALLAEYLLTSVHHADEGLGLVTGSLELGSLLAPLTFGLILLITVGLLSLYRRTRKRVLLVLFSLMTVLQWIAAIGLFDGFYNHTLSLVLTLSHVAPQIMQAIYPTYLQPSIAHIVSFACDGSPFHFCSLTPADLLYETTGVLQLAAAGALTVTLIRLLRATWRETPREDTPASPLAVVGGGLGFAAALAAAPFLGAFMSTQKISFFVFAIPVMIVGSVSVIVAQVRIQGRP